MKEYKPVGYTTAIATNMLTKYFWNYEDWQDGPLQGVLKGFNEVISYHRDNFSHIARNEDLTFFYLENGSVYFDATCKNPEKMFTMLANFWEEYKDINCI